MSVLIKVIFCRILSLFPGIKKAFAAYWYRKVLADFPTEELIFMNYGFSDPSLSRSLNLSAADENNRLCIQLYHQLVSPVDLKNKEVLEIGCGFGGGGAYMAKCFAPRTLTAIDANARSISEATRMHRLENLSFLAADCEKTPFPNNCFDAVVNVESSHCYPSMPRFLKEVYRILKPNGFFLFCDFRQIKMLPSLKRDLEKGRLTVVKETDITGKVCDSLDRLSDSRERLVNSASRGPLRMLMREFAALKGTEVYNSFKTRKYVYLSYVLQK